MKPILLIAGLAVAASVLATQSHAQELPTQPTQPTANAEAITISCYRGPWEDVIWDRPNAIFLDGLTRLGYTWTEAEVIGRRVCRDEYGYKNPDYLKSTVRRIIAETPPRG